jgi:exodeoxyribonuclease VII small subunit
LFEPLPYLRQVSLYCLSWTLAQCKEVDLEPQSHSEPEPADVPCFEDALAELETIVHELEDGELGLGESLARYEQGIKRLKQCYEHLQEAERKIELLTGVRADGTPITASFDETATAAEESAGRRKARASGRASGAKKTAPAGALPPMSVSGEAELDDMDGE